MLECCKRIDYYYRHLRGYRIVARTKKFICEQYEICSCMQLSCNALICNYCICSYIPYGICDICDGLAKLKLTRYEECEITHHPFHSSTAIRIHIHRHTHT